MAIIKKQRDRSQWEQLVGQQSDSGLSGAAFCRENAISYASFMGWRKRLSQDDMPASSFIELTAPVAVDATPAPGLAIQAGDLCVELSLGGGIELRISRHRI